MSEHAAEASAVALPLSEPPVSPPPSALSSPPPQPAAAKASAANSAKKANAFERLVTLPPRSHVAGLTVRLIRGSIRTSSAARNLGADAATVRSRRSGGTGRRAGLKIRWPSGLVGSIPTSGIRRWTSARAGSPRRLADELRHGAEVFARTQLRQAVRLDLANPLACHVERLPELVERVR